MPHPKIQLLLEMLDEMWNADTWIDPLGSALEGWSIEQARIPYAPNLFSIEEMVNHVAFWEEFAKRQLTGESLDDLGSLEDAAWGKSPDWMLKWPQTTEGYRQIRVGLRDALLRCDLQQLSLVSETDSISREGRIYTRAIHGSYHAGQLSLLRRLCGLEAPVANKSPKPQIGTAIEGAKALLLEMVDSAWHSSFSINPFEALSEQLDSEQADWRPRKDLPSITEIVNHMKFWEEYVWRRLRGKSTDNMAVVKPGEVPQNMPHWTQAREDLIAQHQALRDALSDLDDEQLALPRPGQGKRFEEGKSTQWLVYGVTVHHAYHIGQLVLLRQLAGDAE